MKIAILHYHLKTGGVTSVIRQQISALNPNSEVLLLADEAPPNGFPADVVCIPDLGYTAGKDREPDPKAAAEAVLTAIHHRWPDGCDILHIHNPLLKKNSAFLKIIQHLQKHDLNLFLQIHDFAEDGRPASYYSDAYPEDCHYGVINSRDYNALLKAGLKPEGLHKIPNMVSHARKGLQSISRNQVLYPVRAIRRKNIGEAILLSLFFKNGETLAITLPPNSPVDKESYEDWKRFVAENDLKVSFDVGLKEEFPTLLSSSRYLITTSISEGFGFSFLEPWVAGKMLYGRKLPSICYDFEADGIDLSHLYTRLRIPIEWINEISFFRKWEASIAKACRLFDYEIEKSQIDRAFNSITRDGYIDFGLLDEEFQQQIIARIISDALHHDKILALNSKLGRMADLPTGDRRIQRNSAVIGNCYNAEKYRNRLLSIYEKMMHMPIRHRIKKQTLFSHLLDLNNFSLLKRDSYAKDAI